MRILVVSQWFPYPPNNGARKRAYNLLKGLCARHKVHLLCFTQHKDDLRYAMQVSEMCRDTVFMPCREYMPSTENALKSAVSLKPRSFIGKWHPGMVEAVKEQLTRYSFDAAVALTTMMADYIIDCNMPRVLDNDNADTAYFGRLVGLADNKLTKFRRKLTWVKVAVHEKRLISAFDATTAVSDDDKSVLERLSPDAGRLKAIRVVPNGVDLGLLGYKTPEVDTRQVVSTGALTYHANLDAAVFFCKEIWPAIKTKVPNAHFLVTGNYDGVDTSGIRANGVKLTGYVQDINPVVAGSAALVVPLRIGGGTRLKILESMALGTPVISTELGAMGLGLVHNETALLADTPEDFADCTVRLMTDPNLRQRLSANGRAYVAERFGWDRSVEALESAIEYAIDRWHRRN